MQVFKKLIGFFFIVFTIFLKMVANFYILKILINQIDAL